MDRIDMKSKLKRVCVYCGSNPGAGAQYAEAARGVGLQLAQRGIGIVFGGGSVGLMGVVADAVIDAGGEAIGIIPNGLRTSELAHQGVTSLITVDSMHERKQRMVDMADAFIALPGGIGTMDELFETWTWLQLGIHSKPVGLLNVAGYYDGLVAFLGHMRDERFLRDMDYQSLIVDDLFERLLDRLAAFRPPDGRKWTVQEVPLEP
jgi:uncharacterized protein (TIGR00730 family)